MLSERQTEAKALYDDRKHSKLDCVQAVLTVFQPESDMDDETVASSRKYRGGRAEEGVCGAFYAARRLIPDPMLMHALQQEYVALAGSTKCKKIRKMNLLPCSDCVALATGFIEKHITSIIHER